jgi:hypothetical protein
MDAAVKLEVIIEALEMADDSISCYLDGETGEVRSITEEDFDLAADPQTVSGDLPNWQREAVKLAQSLIAVSSKKTPAHGMDGVEISLSTSRRIGSLVLEWSANSVVLTAWAQYICEDAR